jgi:tetratricopeptide (TPR) repeat protein
MMPEARADGPASGAAQPGELARMRYRQGVEAYRAARYRESIDYFLEADHLAPSAALSFNIARAYEKIDDVAAALRWYRDYLRRAPDAKDRADTEALIHGFEQRLVAKGVQQLTILSDPTSATVVVDGQPVGVTPWTAELVPGPHQLTLQLEGHEELSEAIDVPADHATDLTRTLAVATRALIAAPVAPPPASGPAPGEAPPQGRKSSTLTTLGIIGLSAGGAALGGAVVFEFLRRSAESDAKTETTQIGYNDRLNTMESRQTVARVLAVTGAGLAIAGGVLLFVGHGKEGSAPSATARAACVPGACWSTVRGSF